MKLVGIAAFVFCFLSAGLSAPVTDCETLTQRLSIAGREPLLGRWTYIAESTDIPGSKMLTKMFAQTSWWDISAAEQEGVISTFQSIKMLGQCFTITTSVTVQDSVLTMEKPYPSTGVLLRTGCPDCMVFYSNYTIGTSVYSGLQIISRRPKVSAAELEEFSKQLSCLSLPSATVMDSEKGFCPDPAVSPDTKTTDLTESFSMMSSDGFSMIEKFFKSEKTLKTFADLLSMFQQS